VEGAWRNIHTAEAELVGLIPGAELPGRSAEIMAIVELCLPATDPRRIDLQQRYVTGMGAFAAGDQMRASRALLAAFREYDDQRARVRSFRNVIIAVGLLMTAVAVVLALVAAQRPTPLSLCFKDQCPTGTHTAARAGDVVLVEILGAAAALLVGATSISRLRGTSTPYALPVVLSLFKVPTGALSAVFGLLLIIGGFAPGTSLTSTGQIVAWALLFGAAQQTFTGLIDRQAQVVLNSVTSTEQRPPSR
jgi:hypothetical protein